MATVLRKAPDLAFLQEFYLLSVCIRDAENHNVKFTWNYMSFDDYVAYVVTSSAGAGNGILDVMAETDPFACIRIAQICGIDLLKERSDLVVKHAERPAFLAMVVNLLRDNRVEQNRGAQVLFLAGMRSPLVRV
jgi:hypothetical protein